MPAGRFAPSPTGPLHLGSLLAAVASYICAKQSGIDWLVRFDDLDTPRNQAGVEPEILATLIAHGLLPDREPIFQSQRTLMYQQALDRLLQSGHCFYCRCARKSLPAGQPYPGACRSYTTPREDSAIRFRIPTESVRFDDQIYGPQCFTSATDVGDFIVRRRDGIFAYHLACAVDDGEEEIVQVVRGQDLLLQTAPQIALMNALELAIPTYAHLPLITDKAGIKLSKQSHAPSIDVNRATHNLRAVLAALGLNRPPSHSSRWQPADWLSWAIEEFRYGAVPTASASASDLA